MTGVIGIPSTTYNAVSVSIGAYCNLVKGAWPEDWDGASLDDIMCAFVLCTMKAIMLIRIPLHRPTRTFIRHAIPILIPHEACEGTMSAHDSAVINTIKHTMILMQMNGLVAYAPPHGWPVYILPTDRHMRRLRDWLDEVMPSWSGSYMHVFVDRVWVYRCN